MGELCISPVGLSVVTKLAPLRLASVMMGVWFLINFVANWLAGQVGALAETLGDLTIFGGITGVLVVFALILWAVSGRLVQWMHGAEAVTA
jgi:POT family proton-dependent oligopeptide transporter